MNQYSPSPSAKRYVIGGLAAFFVLLLLVGGCNYASSFDAPRPGYAAVCQTGGPIEGDSGTCGVLAPGSGKQMIGYENKLVEFPAQQRFYRFGPGGDAETVNLPTADGVESTIESVTRFSLAVDEETLLDFYRKYGTRTYGGPSAVDDPDQWWTDFLNAQVKPLIESGLREEIAKYACSELNPSCDLSKLNADLTKISTDKEEDKAKGRDANQKLTQISAEVTRKLISDLKTELKGDFFRGVSFRLVKVTPPKNLRDEISAANAAKARLITAKADAAAEKEAARGKAEAQREEAEGIKAINRARQSAGKLAIQIEIAKALCGTEGCQNLQVLGGGNSSMLLDLGSKK